MNKNVYTKFENNETTANGDLRASVTLTNLKTLWFNTGSQCNLNCQNCYMESSPTNDSLLYMSANHVLNYLNEIKQHSLQTDEIALTGGEPFLNPEIIEIIDHILYHGHNLLILTNAVRLINRYKEQLLDKNKSYPGKLVFRVSLDHYTKETHDKIRGNGSFDLALKNIKWLHQNDFEFTIAGRSLGKADILKTRQAYFDLLSHNEIYFKTEKASNLIVFPEMDDNVETPEITTKCWSILNKKPSDIMCSSSRMIVHKKGEESPVIVACTLLPYSKNFEFGQSLNTMKKTIPLNHRYCSQFCVLGGSSCS